MTDGITDLVLERIEEGYLVLDGAGTVLEANRAARALLGADGSLAGADVGSLPDGVGDVLSGGPSRSGGSADDGSSPVVDVSDDGGASAVEVEVTSVGRGGEADRLVLLRDAAAEAESLRYRGILESSGDGLYALDPDGHYTYTNRANTELLGYDESEMLGMHVSEIMDAEDIERIESVIGELIEDGSSRRVVVEHDVITDEGGRIPVENHIALLVGDDGTFQGTAGVVRDVTERKAREEQLERYERIVEAMGDGVYALDEEGRYVAVNDYALELTGYDREELLGTNAAARYDEEDREKFERAIQELLREDEPGVRTVEATLRRADGGDVPIEVNLSVLTGEDGEFRGTVGVVRDVTDRRERLQELERHETLLGIMPDTVVVTDTDGDIVDLHGFEGWSGYGRDELVGEHLSKVTSEEDVEKAEALVAELVADPDREKVTYEMDIVTEEGERIPHENHLALLPPDEDGMIPGSMSVLRDISERKAREEQLERYERIVDAMGDGIYVIDAEGEYVAVNDALVEITGYDRERFIGSRPGFGYDEADVERFQETIRELLAADDPGVKTVEAPLETASGEEIYVEVTLTALTGEDGEFRGTVGVVRDVTERKERQQELERYETLLEVMPDTVVVTDTEGRNVEIHGFEGWSGYDVEELIGEHISVTMPEEEVEKAGEIVGELVRNDDLEKATFEQTVVTKDGERVPHENHLALLPPDEDGMIPGSMSVLRNISDRKERERAMRTLHDATREMVTAGSKQAVAKVAHEAAADVLGLTQTGVHLYDEDAGALVPVAWTEALEDDLGEPPALGPDSLAWSVFEDGEALRVADLWDSDGIHNPDTPFRSEMIVPLGDHGVALFASTEPAVFDADDQRFGEVLCSNAAAAMDRIGREEDLRERERELERKNERLEEFASVVSHDLRNPLNVAHARVKMAVQSGSTEGMEKADDALDRMNELIDDLLTLAREGQAVGETEPVDLRSVANEAWDTVEAPDASLAIDVDRTIEADRARLAELFGNLFRNSIEHAGEGATVRVGELDDGDGFYVEDDGPGIPPDEREAVFEHGVSGSADGTGFGLAIVEDIAEAHGWSVRATEGTAGGARFEFTPTGSDGADEEQPG